MTPALFWGALTSIESRRVDRDQGSASGARARMDVLSSGVFSALWIYTAMLNECC
jgi:hypothetical protein